MSVGTASERGSQMMLSGAELATAFDGRLERARASLGYRIGLMLVAGAMVLLPVIYFAMIAGTIALVLWHVTHSHVMFQHMRGRAVLLAGLVYVAPIIAGGVLVLFMLLPLFWRSRKGPRPLWVDRREQPLLYAYVDKLCDTMHVPRPTRIDITASANASAHIDNGLFGLIRRRLVLTIGLPLAEAMTLKQFTGVLAHELGHFAQGSSMRLSYVVHRINMWFARMAYEPSGIDDAIDEWANDEPHWAISLICLLCMLALAVVRVILKALALVSHALSMHLSRQAEYDADRKAARIVGSEAMGDGLQMLPFIAASHDLALERAESGWSRRALPDDLVMLTGMTHQRMPEEVRDALTSQILMAESSWFDTHPPLYKRVGALKKAKLQGVLKLLAPATALFRNFDELSRLATIDLYQSILGQTLRPEHLYSTAAPASSGNRAQAPGRSGRPVARAH